MRIKFQNVSNVHWTVPRKKKALNKYYLLLLLLSPLSWVFGKYGRNTTCDEDGKNILCHIETNEFAVYFVQFTFSVTRNNFGIFWLCVGFVITLSVVLYLDRFIIFKIFLLGLLVIPSFLHYFSGEYLLAS